MKNWKLSALIMMALLGLFVCNYSIAADGKEAKAVETSKKWLSLVDDGKYSDSWETAADYFKAAITKTQWVQAITGVRKPLGKVISRTLKSKQYRTTLPGAPDGEYLIIQFETSFDNKKTGIETITPMLDKDGVWRVSGYYIK